MTDPLLAVSDLSVSFPLSRGFTRRRVYAVNGVSLDVAAGETLGVVGESGSGKTTLGRAMLRLLRPAGGRITFEGRDITDLSDAALRPVRARMQMVFQDPYTSLNPQRTVGRIIGDVLAAHGWHDRGAIDDRVAELLAAVGLDPDHARRLPRAFSGGQRQRIGLARALALRPGLIVADEPVSALDVSVQAQVINLMADLQEEHGLAYVFIAHDLGLVRQIADRVAVMYLGLAVEVAPAEALYAAPMHPYTDALLSVQPVPDPAAGARRRRVLLTGDQPSPIDPPPGCPFHTRCPQAGDLCARVRPPLVDHGAGRRTACHFPMNADAAAAARAESAAARAEETP